MWPSLKTRNIATNGRRPMAIAVPGCRVHSHHTIRRGIATIWVLVALPVVLTLLVMIVDGGNLWVARMELKNALDAAALSGVKTWGEGSSTSQARLDAHDAFNTNTILGTQYVLSTVEGGCTNGNPAPSATADIILGTISDGAGGFTFDCQGTPACVTGTFTLVIAVDTSDPPIAPCDGGANDTFARASAFRVESFTTSDPALTLNNLTFTIPGAGFPTGGFFDLRNPPPSNDASSGYTSGMGPGTVQTPPRLYYRGAPPTTNATTLVLSACASPRATFGITSAFYNVPPAPAPPIGLTDPPDVTSTSFRWVFTGFQGGDVFAFGVDTDYANGVTGGGGSPEVDTGGEFAGATVSGNVSGTAFSSTLLLVSVDRSAVTINGVVTGGDAFGVRARKTVSVPSIASAFLGLPVSPYQVTSLSYARYACSNGPPQLIHINTYNCACP